MASSSRDLGLAALQAGDLSRALAHLDTAVKQFPTDGYAWAGLGQALCRSGRAGEGVPALQRAVQLLPHDADVRYSLGMGLEMLGKRAEAAGAFHGALTRRPGHPGATAALQRVGGMPGFGAVPSPYAASLGAANSQNSRGGWGGPALKLLLVLLLLSVVGVGLAVWRLPGLRVSTLGRMGVPAWMLPPGPVIDDAEGGFRVQLPPGYPEPTLFGGEVPGAANHPFGIQVKGLRAYSSLRADGAVSVSSFPLPMLGGILSPRMIVDAMKNGIQGRNGNTTVTEIKHGTITGVEMQGPLPEGGNRGGMGPGALPPSSPVARREFAWYRTRIFFQQDRMITLQLGAESKSAANDAAANAFFRSLQIR